MPSFSIEDCQTLQPLGVHFFKEIDLEAQAANTGFQASRVLSPPAFDRATLTIYGTCLHNPGQGRSLGHWDQTAVITDNPKKPVTCNLLTSN